MDAAAADKTLVMVIMPDGDHRRFVRENRHILEQYYVIVEIEPQMRHYEQVSSRYRTRGKGYHQYFGFTAILDSSGTVLATSGEIPDGPIGIPMTTDPKKREKYLQLLAETAKGITQDELSTT